MRTVLTWIGYLAVLIFCLVVCEITPKEHVPSHSTDIAYEHDDRLLLFATIDGSLVAIERQTGQIRWKVKDRPIVQVPIDTKKAIIPMFLPDPRDGSLYVFDGGQKPLKKLPFTIPQLVASSPCRSSDGILYTGKKKDTWFALDPKTGFKQQISGWDVTSPTCPVETTDRVYVGRTHYTIMMMDSRKPQRKWNVTFYDYTATPLSKHELTNYDLVHFASSSTGRLITMDRRSGTLLWDGDLGSPIVSAYILDPEGLFQVPFTSLANHTLSHLQNHLVNHQELPFQSQPGHMKLYPTLYIGEHVHGLYAIPSLVDENMVTITTSENGPLLLGGPNAPDCPKPYPEYPIPGVNYPVPAEQGGKDKDPLSFQSVPGHDNNFVIFIGHYNVPSYTNTRFLLPGFSNSQIRLLTHESKQINKDFDSIVKNSIGVQTDDFIDAENDNYIAANIYDANFKGFVSYAYNITKLWINQQENKGLKLTLIILVGCIVAMFWYLQMQVREFQQLSQNGSKSSHHSSIGRNGPITAIAEELPDGLVRVGKITFHPDELLGKGCEGTFVYRGEFDSRKVAVKRLLPECFTFADREVALLRESDAHPNVVRYFCTEQDKMFRYIALELCQATLADYVLGKCDTTMIKPLDILKQATSGLAHLHSLDIVHRDIKPHNVLLSMPDNRGQVRAMISDFGLCKKLQVGRVSFSRRSGVTGTDGWIAPEMLSGNERTTCAVDLFSLGCLFYYVLSEGEHPFGDTLRRQANILSDESDLDSLKGTEWQKSLQKPLIAALISSKPPERPPCNAVLAHPIFWDSAKILAFFQDVSDRVEKAELDDSVLCALETNGKYVIKADWRLHIHDEVAKDLRKYRTYRGESVRDLLRALRNKKHHFRELTREAQDFLGQIPDNFTNYWLSRFPLLLIHVWITMQCVANENTFKHYYYTKHHYSLSLFTDFVITDDVKQTYLYHEQTKMLDSTKETYEWVEVNKSPKKSSKQKYFEQKTQKRNVRHYYPTENVPKENLGLYRNLNSSWRKPQNDSEDKSNTVPIVDVNDINVQLIKDGNRYKTNRRPNQYKTGASRAPDKTNEPLVWSIKDKKEA